MPVVIVVSNGGRNAVVGLHAAKRVWRQRKVAFAVVQIQPVVERTACFADAGAKGLGSGKVDIQKAIAVRVEDGRAGCYLLHEVVLPATSIRLDERQAGALRDVRKADVLQVGRGLSRSTLTRGA